MPRALYWNWPNQDEWELALMWEEGQMAASKSIKDLSSLCFHSSNIDLPFGTKLLDQFSERLEFFGRSLFIAGRTVKSKVVQSIGHQLSCWRSPLNLVTTQRLGEIFAPQKGQIWDAMLAPVRKFVPTPKIVFQDILLTRKMKRFKLIGMPLNTQSS